MPCFKGLAVSIHTPQGPLPEHSIQKQNRFSRISSYIPVPPPKIPPNNASASSNGNGRSEQSTFAISITLLIPGLSVPYSSPKPTPEHPYPQPRKVGSMPMSAERGRYNSPIIPYAPLTTSPNETIAAYIYFDGRPKEEVATLLRRGEETWVNSRWVSVPDSEGGGLAEREFLFREVGLERWLNGLDLDGKDAAAKIEKRRQKVENKRRRRKIKKEPNSDDEAGDVLRRPRERNEKGVLRYGDDTNSPLENVNDSDDMLLSETDEDSDDDPVPESAGQIKVALYRVLASGEIRRGEYSPQFDAHDGDEDVDRMEGGDGISKPGETEEVDHTTSFAKPKTLDPKSISTQTVTGIDPQDKPFAVFTFLYRGEKQLQKMGILSTPSKPAAKTPLSNGKPRSMQDDFAKFKPLSSNGLKNFSNMRDPGERSRKSSNNDKAGKRRQLEDDSDEDVDIDEGVVNKAEIAEDKDADGMLSPEEARKQGELAEEVGRIKLKRQHSADHMPTGSPATAPNKIRKTPPDSNTPVRESSPAMLSSTPAPHAPTSTPNLCISASTGPLLPSVAFSGASGLAGSTSVGADSVGSPLKKARSSLTGMDDEEMRKRFGVGLTGVKADVLGNIEHDRITNGGGSSKIGGGNVGPGPAISLAGAFGEGSGATSGEAKNEAAVGKEVKLEDMEEEEEL